jgi:hypothetical protein
MIPTTLAASGDPAIDAYGATHLSNLPKLVVDNGSIHNHFVGASYDSVEANTAIHGINSHSPTLKKYSKK